MEKNDKNNNFQYIQDFAMRETLAFAKEHQGEDTARLLLSASRYPSIDMPAAVQQIEGLRVAQEKWPSLLHYNEFLYPPRLNREQSSSEATARYKAGLFAALGGGRLADLTGGMGVDTFFMSQDATEADYYEVDEELCDIAQHNFAALGAGHIACHCCDSLGSDAALSEYDLIFIDPARRDNHGHKVAAFEDCTPNLLDNLGLLRSRCRHLMVKASPMVDIHAAVEQLGEVDEVHVVALNGECKEVLFILPCASKREGASQPTIHCVDLDGCGEKSHSHFTWEEEEAANATYASEMGSYLYEPNAALMKGGCYNSICEWFELKKLARNTHLYTSERRIGWFPGRCFSVLQPMTLNSKEAGRLIPEGKAHVVVRNFPMAAAELQKKLKLKEGGRLFVIGATLGSRPQGWLCEKVEPDCTQARPD